MCLSLWLVITYGLIPYRSQPAKQTRLLRSSIRSIWLASGLNWQLSTKGFHVIDVHKNTFVPSTDAAVSRVASGADFAWGWVVEDTVVAEPIIDGILICSRRSETTVFRAFKRRRFWTWESETRPMFQVFLAYFIYRQFSIHSHFKQRLVIQNK